MNRRCAVSGSRHGSGAASPGATRSGNRLKGGGRRAGAQTMWLMPRSGVVSSRVQAGHFYNSAEYFRYVAEARFSAFSSIA